MNIVLVHGILGFSHIDVPLKPVDYFAGVAAELRKHSCVVSAPALDPTAGIDERAKELRARIAGAIQHGDLKQGNPVHIIAHSMGGLDARKLISDDPTIEANGSRTPIQSLVTISTPHRGSPVADVVALKFLPELPFLAEHVFDPEAAAQKVASYFPISLDGLHDLTSEAAHKFDTACRDQPTVRYLSFAGRGRAGLQPTSAFFLPYYNYVRLKTRGEDNDGVVTVSSARHGTFDTNLWPCDHADEIGHNLDLPLASPSPELLQRYVDIIKRL